jgi:dual specificity tyrosine-phosphorylation-regulated kinase 2/3/4
MVNIENSKTVYQIGAGGFGKIFLCEDNQGKKFVSKQITSNSSFFNELTMYKELLGYTEYFPQFYNYFVSDVKKCIYLENCQEDLRKMLDNKTEICVESFVVHISEALEILNKKNIIHCDLKPENILYEEKSDLFKICDFGISCYTDSKKNFPVQTMYYRAPEVIIRKNYGISIDMWSFGCIIYEIIYGDVLFFSREEEYCFMMMINTLGLPPGGIYQNFLDNNIFFEGEKTLLKNCNNLPETEIIYNRMYLTDTKEDIIITDCLKWHPEERITPEEVIEMYQ